MNHDEAVAIVMELASGSYSLTKYTPLSLVEEVDYDQLNRAIQALAVVSAGLLTDRMREGNR